MPNLNPDLIALALRFKPAYASTLSTEELRSPALAKSSKNLLDSNPNKYGQILDSLLNGNSITATAKSTHSNPDLVSFIYRFHPEIPQAQKDVLVSHLQNAILTLSNQLQANAHLIKPDNIPRAIQTLTQELALLTGNPTHHLQISQPLQKDKIIKMFNDLHKDLPSSP